MASVPIMRPPEPGSKFDVGDIVEVFCDHEKGDERIRGWLKGIVVQVDSIQIKCLSYRWLDGSRSYSLVSGYISASTNAAGEKIE
ncbi:MAG: hypothetical protein LWX83_10870 [Anaerolineae bacterium]|nr:hypothetical protein [Anaerolineae bacterium]